MRVAIEQASEIVDAGSSEHAVLTCEHASERLPEPWRWPDGDRWLQGTHWAFDLGAADLARDLARSLDTVAVLARFTRLLVDPNRPEDASDLFRKVAEGRPVDLNREIGETDRERRLALYRDYHSAVDRAVLESRATIVLSVHTFTPVYEGMSRTVEIGVLFDDQEALAKGLATRLDEEHFRVALNEPYSGRAGLIYSADRHARQHGRRALELEVRQDLAVQPAIRTRVATAVTEFLRRPTHRGQ